MTWPGIVYSSGSALRLRQASAVLVMACLSLPWLNPYAVGPSSFVNPWLFSALCMAALYFIYPPAGLRREVSLALAGLAAWAVLRSGLTPETLALAGGCLLILMAAGFAARAAQQAGLAHVVAWAWLLAALASTAIALLQYFGAAEALVPWVNASAAGEAFANLRQRNQFASLTVIGMASLLWLSRRGLAHWPAKAAMAWLAIGNAATTSRTGLLLVLLLAVLAFVWPAPRLQRVVLWVTALAAYALAALALPLLLEIATGVAGNHLWDRVAAVDACSSRTVLWANVLQLIAHAPWLGWGWGALDYAHFATLYEGPRFCDILDNAHNLPLHLAVELGIPAALLVCGGLLWAVARAKPWAETDPGRQMAWAVLVAIGVHSLLEYPLWYGPFQIALGLCLGLLWPALPAHGDRRLLPWSRALAVAVVAACGYAAWDYRRVSQIYLPPEARASAYASETLRKIRSSWLFRSQASFAELTITPLTQANAQWTFETSTALLRYSPEPRVIEKLIESGVALGRDDEALLYLARFRTAFPQAYESWSRVQSGRRLPGDQ